MKSNSPISDAVKIYVESLPSKQYDYISPSQLGGCMRKHFYLIKGVVPTTPPSSSAETTFAVGRLWEGFIAHALDYSGWLVKHYQDGEDVLKLPGLHLAGTPDILARIDGELVVVDSKTVNSAWFQYRKRASQESWYKDNHEYVVQIAAYIMLLRANGVNVERGILAFASKDDGYIGVELQVELTPELEQEITERCHTLMSHLASNTLPPCECEGWRMGYCLYGNPQTRKKNDKGKMLNTECCSEALYET